jgi:hypothetical protein
MTTTGSVVAAELRRIATVLDRISAELGEQERERDRRADEVCGETGSTQRSQLMEMRCYLAACAGQLERLGAELGDQGSGRGTPTSGHLPAAQHRTSTSPTSPDSPRRTEPLSRSGGSVAAAHQTG